MVYQPLLENWPDIMASLDHKGTAEVRKFCDIDDWSE